MTGSLPDVAHAEKRSSGAPKRKAWLEGAVTAATRITMKGLPLIPARAKRLLAGGRSVTIEGNTLDPTLRLLQLAARATGSDGLVVEGDVAKSRAQVRATAEMIGGTDTPVRVDDVTIPGPGGPIRARHYRPADGETAPLLVFYHGGGFVIADLDVYEAPCRLICRDAGVHVLSIDYRLAPEHKAPAALDDAYAAFRWAQEHAADLGADPGRVAVGGDSAGGCLAAAVAQRARVEGEPLPVFQLLIYPMTDLSRVTRSRTLFGEGFFLTKRDMDWFEGHYVDDSGIERTDPRVSPVLAADLSGLPPALVVTAGFDPLRDEGDHYAAALRAAGVPVDHRRMGSMTHLFINYAPLGGGIGRAMAEITSALRAHLAHD